MENGATLSGTGTVGGLEAQAGATRLAGLGRQSLRHAHVSGPASFASGATYAIAINPAGSPATWRSTAPPRSAVPAFPSLRPAALRPCDAIHRPDRGGRRQGPLRFDPTTDALAFLNPYLSYGSNRVTLAFHSNGAPIGSVAHTPNQQSVAVALQGLDPNSPVVRSLQGLSPDQARRALDALAGSTMPAP